MKKYLFHKRRYIGIFIILSILLVFPGCSKQPTDGFAIYFTKNNIPPSQMEAQSHLTLAEDPTISIDDIITYNAQTHEIKLTVDAYERLLQLEVPVQGKSFVVCIDKQPVYWGAFWVPYSSQSFDGVTIWKPMQLQEPYIITLQLGYPSGSFYGGEDPRNNQEIFDALDEAGKLVNKLTISSVPELPASFKGYELYSWLEKNEWHYNLITGTNRNKTVDEIVSEPDYISETAWVNIHVTGIEAMEMVFSKLPEGEDIFWLSNPRVEQGNSPDIKFGFPSATDINSLKIFAAERGLNLTVEGDW